jgi:hypothetical protein
MTIGIQIKRAYKSKDGKHKAIGRVDSIMYFCLNCTKEDNWIAPCDLVLCNFDPENGFATADSNYPSVRIDQDDVLLIFSKNRIDQFNNDEEYINSIENQIFSDMISLGTAYHYIYECMEKSALIRKRN